MHVLKNAAKQRKCCQNVEHANLIFVENQQGEAYNYFNYYCVVVRALTFFHCGPV